MQKLIACSYVLTNFANVQTYPWDESKYDREYQEHQEVNPKSDSSIEKLDSNIVTILYTIIFIAIWIFSMVTCSIQSHQKGYGYNGWIMGCLFGLLGIVYWCVTEPTKEKLRQRYCFEQKIKQEYAGSLQKTMEDDYENDKKLRNLINKLESK